MVVIGGGRVGLAAAAALAEGGARVHMVEARSQLGGAVGHGVVYAGLTEHVWRLVSSLGAQETQALLTFADRGLLALEGLGALSRTGCVWAASEADREPAEIGRSVDALRAMGRTAEVWTPETLAARTGTALLGPAYLVAEEGGCDAATAVAALTARCLRAGVRLQTACAALGIDDHGGQLAVRTEHGPVITEAVVVAAEAGARGLHGYFADTLTPVREQALRLQGGPPLVSTLRAGFGWTVARRDGDSTIVSGCRFASPHLEEGEVDDTVTTPAVQARLEGFARRHLPGCGAVIERWSWITAHGCDGLPMVGPLPTDPRIVVAVGFAGHGSSLGLAAAEAVAAGLLGVPCPPVPRCLSSFRFL